MVDGRETRPDMLLEFVSDEAGDALTQAQMLSGVSSVRVSLHETFASRQALHCDRETNCS